MEIPLPDVAENQLFHSVRKRLFDIVFSLFALALAAPLFIAIALLIKWVSHGPVFYAQERIGRGGVHFPCYKFRTMYPDADSRLEALLAEDPELAREWAESHKLKRDPRVTSIGRFLRKTSLDELPQFWNVLRGDLSVVGPRPIVADEVHKYFGERAAVIWRVRPGITGPWQISGRSDVVDYTQRISLDETYVANWSFLWDLQIVVQTIPAILLARGAY